LLDMHANIIVWFIIIIIRLICQLKKAQCIEHIWTHENFFKKHKKNTTRKER